MIWSFCLCILLIVGAVSTEIIDPPPKSVFLGTFYAKGFQEYVCKNSKFELIGPRARLFVSKKAGNAKHSVGHHTYLKTPINGARIVFQAGKDVVVADRLRDLKVARPRGKDVDLLLLSVKAASGSGPLSRANWVQRVNTMGGLPRQTRCRNGAKISIPYSAYYYFYA